MWLLPKHPVSRRIATAWLLACLATLIVMLVRVEIHDDRPALSTLVPLYWLSLPLGHAGVLTVIRIKTALYVSGAAPGILAEGMMQWIALGVLGYAQWFVLLPFVARKCQQLLQFLFNRETAKGGPAR
jgi:hypothetical protein